VKLNKKFASKIGAELAILDKERPAQQVAEIGYVIGDVQGRPRHRRRHDRHRRDAARRAQTVVDEGASRVYATAHARDPQRATPTRIWPPLAFEQIVVTPTRSRSARARPNNLRVLSCAELLTDSIRRIFTDGQRQ
jgi:ribose-phosphate pyrophosphokinase